MHVRHRLIHTVWVLVLLNGARCLAQGIDPPEISLRQGAAACEKRNWAECAETLRNWIPPDPEADLYTFRLRAFWLGTAYAHQGEAENAHATWKEGVSIPGPVTRADVPLFDAFVRSTFERGIRSDSRLASEVWLRLLEALDAGPSQPELDIHRDHLAGMLPVLPPAVVSSLGVSAFLENYPDAPLAPTAGHALADWWRRADAIPATERNERILEHLGRVTFARPTYFSRGEFDARGALFIRLGPPSRKIRASTFKQWLRLDIAERHLRQDMADWGTGATLRDFPEHEIWLYDHIDESAVYIFVERRGDFQEGSVSDLLPRQLVGGQGRDRPRPSARWDEPTAEPPRARAGIAHRALELILEELAPQHPVFALRYANLQMQAPRRNDLALSRARSEIAEEDQRLWELRELRVPQSYTSVFGSREHVMLLTRAARFLEPDGTTRIEVYGGIPAGFLAPSKEVRDRLTEGGIGLDRMLLAQSLVLWTAEGDRISDRNRWLLSGLGVDPMAGLGTRTVTTRCGSPRCALALQWDLIPISLGEDGRLQAADPPVRSFLSRSDSLVSLSRDPEVLEMSDLKPVVLIGSDQTVLPSAADGRDAQGLVLPSIGGDRRLALYFEVYHLRATEQGAHAYQVAYEIADASGKDLHSTAAMTYRGEGVVARNVVFVDLADWRRAGEVDVTLHVLEPETGREKSRSIRVVVE